MAISQGKVIPDIVLIEAGYEYQFLESDLYPEERKQRIKEGLTGLARICAENNIPVRSIPRDGKGPLEDSELAQTERHYKSFFEGCDYRPGSDIPVIGTKGNDPQIIVLTGGIVRYGFFTPYYLEKVSDREGIDPNRVETHDLRGPERNTAFLWGCVPRRGELILRASEDMDPRPEVYIDPLSAVNGGALLDAKSVYQIVGLQTRRFSDGPGVYVVATKVPRENVLPLL